MPTSSEVRLRADLARARSTEAGEHCQHLAERDALGEAIAQAAIKAGIIDGKSSLTGPQLIMLCRDLAIAARQCCLAGSRNYLCPIHHNATELETEPTSFRENPNDEGRKVK